MSLRTRLCGVLIFTSLSPCLTSLIVSFQFYSLPFQNVPAAGVSVIVISILSTNPVPVSDFQFQAAVPKACELILIILHLKDQKNVLLSHIVSE